MSTNLLVATTVVLGLVLAACGGSSTHSGDDDSSNAGTGGSGGGTGGSGGTAGGTGGTSNTSCVAVCDRAEACPNASPAQDCATQCQLLDRLVAASGCANSLNAFLRCTPNVDICATTSTPCASEVQAFSTCVGTFCTANPMNQACLDYAGG